MIQVSSVDRIFDQSIVFGPGILLLHNLLKWIGEIIFIVSILVDNFIKRRIEFHNWILLVIHLILEETSCPQVVPVLWVVLEEPSIVIFEVELGV